MNFLIEQSTQFNNLSVKDLLEARDLFHVHLMSKANVVGTAIGRYRIRDCQIAGDQIIPKNKVTNYIDERTLSNSKVVKDSWPCIIVFVKKWIEESELRAGKLSDSISPNIYMPDGRVVPICVVAAPINNITDPNVDEKQPAFPDSAVGGGYPLIIKGQGLRKIASVGCIVTDGNKYYALTNKHVLGDPGDIVFTKFKHKDIKIGNSTALIIGNTRFQTVYNDWAQSNLFVNVDAGLIEINDIKKWKTDIYGLGKLGKLVDLNTKNITLKLIGLEVCASGAVSGKMEGEIAALFYRYKSIGGYEYVADFMIGPKNGETTLTTRHGDSGTLWTIESKSETGETEYLPLAMQWGQRTIADPQTTNDDVFALATNLSNVCRDLDVDIVRDWNMDLDFTWGLSGHVKIGYGSTIIVTENKLKELLKNNAANIGISDTDLIDKNVPSGMFVSTFVPMADVPDMYWRTKRPEDSSNHFADMDDQHPQVYQNQRLMDLCFDINGKVKDDWLDIHKWLDFYAQLDDKKPEDNGKPRLGGLPFRVWQMYNEMVEILKNTADTDYTKLSKFIVAGGTMSHYVGDACQPLHISFLHDGYPNGDGKGVHSAYETKMLDTFERKPQSTFLQDITNLLTPVKQTELITGGKAAAGTVLSLMRTTFNLMPPKDIVDNYVTNRSVAKLYDAFGGKTKQTIANGIRTMAILWQSAWIEGGGKNLTIPHSAFKEQELMDLYQDRTGIVPSYKLNDPVFAALCI